MGYPSCFNDLIVFVREIFESGRRGGFVTGLDEEEMLVQREIFPNSKVDARQTGEMNLEMRSIN